MYLIEPCCAPKHLAALRDATEQNITAFFHGYGDLSLAEILPALLIRYCEADMMFVAPSVPDAIAETLKTMMYRQRAKMTGRGSFDVISHLTLVADLSEKRSPMASQWLKENPFGERMTLKSCQQGDTAVLMPDFALIGPMNLVYGRHFTAMATKNASIIRSLREIYQKL